MNTLELVVFYCGISQRKCIDSWNAAEQCMDMSVINAITSVSFMIAIYDSDMQVNKLYVLQQPSCYIVVTCAPAMLQTSIVFVASVCLVCLSASASVHTKSWKLLIRNWCNFVGTCPIVNARSDWKLVTFDLDLWPLTLRAIFVFFTCHAYLIHH